MLHWRGRGRLWHRRGRGRLRERGKSGAPCAPRRTQRESADAVSHEQAAARSCSHRCSETARAPSPVQHPALALVSLSLHVLHAAKRRGAGESGLSLHTSGWCGTPPRCRAPSTTPSTNTQNSASQRVRVRAAASSRPAARASLSDPGGMRILPVSLGTPLATCGWQRDAPRAHAMNDWSAMPAV